MTKPYKPKVSGIYGSHVPYDKGYDAYSQRNFPRAEDKSPSGQLRRGNGETIALWLTDLSANFSLSGQSAQSRMQREFYPRSFNDVTLTLTGNVAGTYEFNRLALFVRDHQWLGLDYINQGGVGVDQLIHLDLYNNTPKPFDSPGLRNSKGGHRPWTVGGYIQGMAAGAVTTAEETAPQFSINMIVAESAYTGTTGLWNEILDSPNILQSFTGLVNEAVVHGDIYDTAKLTPSQLYKPPSKPRQKKNSDNSWSSTVAYNPFSYGAIKVPGG